MKQVQNIPDQLQQLGVENFVAEKSGLLYVYTSNESSTDVFFDNIAVTQISGPLLEETHYYPFGLSMSGISSNLLKGTSYKENAYKFNGNELQSNEFADGSGLEMYDFNMRGYDQQLGRFLQPDLAIDKHLNLSPYNFVMNNPALYSDPSGMDTTVQSGAGGIVWTVNAKEVVIGPDDGYNGYKSGGSASTIYVTGYGADVRVGEYNQYVKDNKSLLSNKVLNDNGTTLSTNISIDFVLATPEDLKRVKNEKLRNGDNILELENSEYRSATGGFTKQIFSKDKNPKTGQWDALGFEHFTDFSAKLGNSSSKVGQAYGSPATAVHEILHMFGLKDWYNSPEQMKMVGPNDIMNHLGNQPILHQIHWNNWLREIKSQQQTNGDNFILNHFVE
ncbi:RHS repeat-associated core domain-containing protein [Chitinophaga sp.]|uniref:RHS repeat domain-containing protein n=1 Tax=Chitinophaga sp. TaxID=1869181 RepID=UPI002F91F31E